MIIYDLIHGYQPFPSQNPPFWVKKNLEEIFLPTSRAMARGMIRRGVQLQGWTVDAWLESPKPIYDLAQKTLDNLRLAVDRGNIEIGASCYPHSFLPLFSEELIVAQIELDIKICRQFLGEPTWFWSPEAAWDQRPLTIVHKHFPNFLPVISDQSLGRKNFSGDVKIRFADDSESKVLVLNTLLKDLFMNAAYYRQKPGYVPEDMDWSAAQGMVHSGKDFSTVLKALGGSLFVLARDWENKGSKDGLYEIEEPAPSAVPAGRQEVEGKVREVRGLVELEAEYQLPSEFDKGEIETVSIDEIKPSCWDMWASDDDPYPFWDPKEKPEIIKRWIDVLKGFDLAMRPHVEDEELLRKVLPALASDFSWHILASKDWEPNLEESRRAILYQMLPAAQILGDKELIRMVEWLKGQFQRR